MKISEKRLKKLIKEALEESSADEAGKLLDQYGKHPALEFLLKNYTTQRRSLVYAHQRIDKLEKIVETLMSNDPKVRSAARSSAEAAKIINRKS